MGLNLGYVTFSSFFIENNLSYLVGGYIIAVAISATAGANMIYITSACGSY